MKYPTPEEELQIVNLYTGEVAEHRRNVIINKKSLLALQSIVRQIPIANDLKQRVVNIIDMTRKDTTIIEYGASPRASIGLVIAAKARALMSGRNHVSAEDINKMAYPILRHRIILNFEAERKGMTTDDAIKEILAKVK